MWANRYLDPLYGTVPLDEFEISIILTPEFQRLRYIRMCNINSMLIAGASEISRFEHCLGTLRLAQEWLNTRRAPTAPRDIEAFKAAALLHDMLSGPFGHSFQYILEDNSGNEFSHDDLSRGEKATYYQDLRANASFLGRPFRAQTILGEKWTKVSEFISGRGALGPLISGTIDLDNIDNVIRLAYHAGIADKSHAQIALSLARKLQPIDGNKLSLDPAGVPLVEEWLNIRRRLYECLLLDWAEFSAKAMLTLAVEEAIDLKEIGNDSWRLTDDELIERLSSLRGEGQFISDTAQRLRCGDLWSPIILKRSTNISLYKNLSGRDVKRDIERRIYEAVRDVTSFKTKFLLHFILDKGKTQRKLKFFIDELGGDVTIGQDSEQLLVGVFASRPISSPAHSSLIEDATCGVLYEYGLTDLEPLPDPLGTSLHPKGLSQLTLF